MVFKSKLLIVLIVFLAVSCGLVFFVINPSVASINNYGSLIGEQKEKIALAEGRMDAIKQFKTFAKNESVNLKKIEGVFVDGNMPLDFISFLEETARISDVGMEVSPAISQTAVKGEWSYLNFKLDLNGKTANILNFIGKMESGRYLVDMTSVVIDSNKGAGMSQAEKKVSQLGSVKAQVIFKVYVK